MTIIVYMDRACGQRDIRLRTELVLFSSIIKERDLFNKVTIRISTGTDIICCYLFFNESRLTNTAAFNSVTYEQDVFCYIAT